MTFKEWLMQIAIWFDQGVNVFFWGFADETLSARAFRLSRDRQRDWPRKVIDGIFRTLFRQQNHCEKAYLSELNRKQLPRSYRD